MSTTILCNKNEHTVYAGADPVEEHDRRRWKEVGHIVFQDGPIKEVGVNGCQVDDVIAIAIERLTQLQTEDFDCRENALAITKLQEALHWLEHRTSNREKRGVEGTSAA